MRAAEEHLTAAPPTPPHSSTLHPHVKGEAPSTQGWIHPQTGSERLQREARVKKINRKKGISREKMTTRCYRNLPKRVSDAEILTQKNVNENINANINRLCRPVEGLLLSIFTDWKHLHLKHSTSLKRRKRPGWFLMSSWKLLWHFQSTAIFNSPHEPDLSGIYMETFWWNRYSRYR